MTEIFDPPAFLTDVDAPLAHLFQPPMRDSCNLNEFNALRDDNHDPEKNEADQLRPPGTLLVVVVDEFARQR